MRPAGGHRRRFATPGKHRPRAVERGPRPARSPRRRTPSRSSRGRRGRSPFRSAARRSGCGVSPSPRAAEPEGRRRAGRVAVFPSPPSGRPGRTRIKPPGDVIKLEDRLHYILQPSLESLLAERSLAMPFRPFPFPVRGRRLPLSAARGDPGRRDGPGKDHAGDHGHPPAAPPRRSAKRAAGLPQAAGDQLAARVRTSGRRKSRCW